MTDKEIYKARVEGYKKIEHIHPPVPDSDFLEFMGFVKEVVEQYGSNVIPIEEEIAEKSEIRKKLN